MANKQQRNNENGRVDFISFASLLAENHGIPKREATAFIREFIATLNDVLQQDKQLKIRNLGTFKVQAVGSRKSVDVNTGEEILLDGREKIVFTPDKALAEQVNKPFAQFQTTSLADNIDFDDIDAKYAQESPRPLPITPATKVSPEKEEEIVVEEDTAEDDNDGGNWLKWLVAVCLVLVLAAGGYVWFAQPQAKDYIAQIADFFTPKKKNALEAASIDTIAKGNPAQTSTFKAQQTADESASTAPISKAKAQQPTFDEESVNNYPGVKLGAWYILGIADTVVAISGQTFQGISKAHLGPGMECYVEAVNGGRKTIQPGDTLFIPKLKNKKALRK